MIYLVLAHKSPSKIAIRLTGHEFHGQMGTIHWLYLGRDFMKLLHWEEGLGSAWSRISYARYFQELALQLKEDYLDWISKIGGLYSGDNALSWWATRMSEKNTLLDSLFHLICYFFTGCYYSKKYSPLLIVSENPSVLTAISSQPDLSKYVKWLGERWSPHDPAPLWETRRAHVWETYLNEGIAAMHDAKVTLSPANILPPIPDKPRVLIHTWVNESYLGDDGNANDSYFTVLPELLTQQGYEVVILPCLYDIKRSRTDAFLWFRRHGYGFLIPEDYYDASDYQWTTGIASKLPMPPEGKHIFKAADISALVVEAYRAQACDAGIGPFLQYYRLFYRLSGKGIHFDYFIDTFENMIPEKLSVMGIKKWMPSVKTVGYQHYMNLNDLLLCFYTTSQERKFAPHPDVIVCNSEITRQQLIDASFDEDRLRIGPSLRYQHLLKKKQAACPANNHVMVITGIDMSARELIIKILQAFPEDEGVMFFIKPHPMVGKETVEWISRFNLPGHMSLVDGKLHELIPECSCAVVAGSTSALEITLLGVPVVIAGRETDFTMHPVTSLWGGEEPVYTSYELRKQVFRALSLSAKEKMDFEQWISAMIAHSVSPINQTTISQFVD